MSLETVLTNLGNARGALVNALDSKGVTVESSATILSCASAILNIPSGGADVTLGYITSGGAFQPLAFSGTTAYDSGSAATLSCYTWNLPVSSGGSNISSGVTIGDSTTSSISSGWVWSSTIVNFGGVLQVLSGGTAVQTTVNHDGGMVVSSGGTANSTTVNGTENRCYLRVSDGGFAANTELISWGYMECYASASADYVTVDSKSHLYIASGGVTDHITVSSGGTLTVSSGGSALNVTSMNGAVIDSSYGGYITYA